MKKLAQLIDRMETTCLEKNSTTKKVDKVLEREQSLAMMASLQTLSDYVSICHRGLNLADGEIRRLCTASEFSGDRWRIPQPYQYLVKQRNDRFGRGCDHVITWCSLVSSVVRGCPASRHSCTRKAHLLSLPPSPFPRAPTAADHHEAGQPAGALGGVGGLPSARVGYADLQPVR
jgi:hypothetical protein